MQETHGVSGPQSTGARLVVQAPRGEGEVGEWGGVGGGGVRGGRDLPDCLAVAAASPEQGARFSMEALHAQRTTSHLSGAGRGMRTSQTNRG
jgi:hypothetical protein